MSGLPAKKVYVGDETRPFWDGTTEGKLVLPRCNACEHVIWFPKTLCSSCGSTDVSWFEASGNGTVYTFTVVRRTGGRWGAVVPYVIAIVELAEGPRMMTNLVDCEPDSVAVGQAVRVTFDDTGEGMALPRFAPA